MNFMREFCLLVFLARASASYFKIGSIGRLNLSLIRLSYPPQN